MPEILRLRTQIEHCEGVGRPPNRVLDEGGMRHNGVSWENLATIGICPSCGGIHGVRVADGGMYVHVAALAPATPEQIERWEASR